jgi:hypothetical protein
MEQTKHVFFIVLSFTRSNVLFSYINLTFPQTSKCFLSNGIKNILASGPELQVVRFGYVILDKHFRSVNNKGKHSGVASSLLTLRLVFCVFNVLMYLIKLAVEDLRTSVSLLLPCFLPNFVVSNCFSSYYLVWSYNSRTGSGEMKVECHASSDTQPNQAAPMCRGNTVHLATLVSAHCARATTGVSG